MEAAINRYCGIEELKKLWGVVKATPEVVMTFPNQASPEGIQLLNKSITPREVQMIAKKLKKEKSPGLDLIPNEAWKDLDFADYEWIAKELTEILHQPEKTPQSWKDVIIRWIHKKDSLTLLSNYRPIALGNTMAKLYMRILTNRLEQLIEEEQLISGEQQGFRTDRSCAEALLTIQTLAARANGSGKAFYVASLDISKAYDTVSHEVLWKVLAAKGIKGYWLEAVKSMYLGSRICSDTTEGQTPWITMKRGIRQGCPLSPIIFAVYMDWLVEQVKTVNIQQTTEPAMLAYADDILLWGYQRQEMQDKLTKVSQSLSELGMALSTQKCVIQSNTWAVSQDIQTRQKAEWNIITEHGKLTIQHTSVENTFKYLGVWMNAAADASTNIDKVEEKVEARLSIISKLKAQPLTKVRLIQARVIPVIEYALSVHCPTVNWLQEIDQKIYGVVTEGMGGLQRCRREVLYEPVEMMGLGLPCLKDRYWITRAKVWVRIQGTGERMKMRGQTGWAAQLLNEEIQKESSPYGVVQDMKDILSDLDIDYVFI